MENFITKKEYLIEDIRLLITNEVEESIYLEFKEANALDKTDNKKKDISKDVASFANSDGGIIVYGIKEENHKAMSISFIDGNEFTKEWLEQIINSTIQRLIQNIKIFPIRENGDITKTVYVIKIPRSLDAPHLSKDKRFYKRFNFQSVPIEEYEIRELYKRKSHSKLVIASSNISRIGDDQENHTKYIFEASVANIGDTMASLYKVNVYFDNYDSAINITWEQHKSNQDYTWFERDRVKISATCNSPIYPEEQVSSIRFFFEISNEKLVEVLSKVKIEIAVFYEHGDNRVQTDFKKNIETFIASQLNSNGLIE